MEKVLENINQIIQELLEEQNLADRNMQEYVDRVIEKTIREHSAADI
ncbi:MAG: hypothetical protein FWH55_12410 [Oscillospiraceae bacterium]|nr:hypothetical protein [Oscillospiraceae bacterium]